MTDMEALMAAADALADAAKEARSDLAVYVDADWPEHLRSLYPSLQTKWDRDMELCRNLDEALTAYRAALASFDKDATP